VAGWSAQNPQQIIAVEIPLAAEDRFFFFSPSSCQSGRLDEFTIADVPAGQRARAASFTSDSVKFPRAKA